MYKISNYSQWVYNTSGEVSVYSFIGSGHTNQVLAHCSAILGGNNNTVSSAYSAILGGSGNTIGATFPYAGVFGCNINAVASNTFHVNCLNACDTPACAAGLPHGTYSYYAVTGAFPAGLAVGTRLLVMIP